MSASIYFSFPHKVGNEGSQFMILTDSLEECCSISTEQLNSNVPSVTFGMTLMISLFGIFRHTIDKKIHTFVENDWKLYHHS